ncbi:PAS domain-containing protein [Streptomyces sp. SL13]|uniref:PAS domain-containing protein n=1 Tax=Streptantibioticus silvisoli TaxID=2705255 RepID=A0AA90H6H0_9ACTN|nr:PAS domain-containing protein [Streptantibioticus silvisoli]MDI5965066.1 PAS domain-containing protein [Streptantibioticus silvisoli]MDI5971815.1 PAS domain-containing protein [Streptantibioticus silvisoli]
MSAGDEPLLAALLETMDAALCAFDADGVVTHWNAEAVRVLGWTARDAVGRRGLAGWAVRSADADEIMGRLLGVMGGGGRQVHEFALVTRDGGRILVRAQTAAVHAPDGAAIGVYCAFSEVHAQIGLERSIALSDALFQDATWGVVLIDADLRPAVVNGCAARALASGRDSLLGRPLGELLDHGVAELEAALHHVLSEGAPTAPLDLWFTLRGDPEAVRHCWHSGFVRLGTPLGEEPVPLGVGWLFSDVTGARLADQEASRLRFRTNQLRRAANVAADCGGPMDAATAYVDYALAGFADHALLDLVGPAGKLVRAAGTPGGPGPCLPVSSAGIPVGYAEGHPALQALDRTGSVRTSCLPSHRTAPLRWPDGTVSALCSVLRSRARTLGVITFLRGSDRPSFDRADAAYCEDVAARVGAVLDTG